MSTDDRSLRRLLGWLVLLGGIIGGAVGWLTTDDADRAKCYTD